MSKIPLEKLRRISESAKDVIDALAGDEDVSRNDSDGIVRLYDYLNDVAAPPSAVKAMADELINLRQTNQMLQRQRIADRRRFANPAPEQIIRLVALPGGVDG